MRNLNYIFFNDFVKLLNLITFDLNFIIFIIMSDFIIEKYIQMLQLSYEIQIT